MYGALKRWLGIVLDQLYRKEAKAQAILIGMQHPLLKFSKGGQMYFGAEAQVLMDAVWLVWAGEPGEVRGPHTKESAEWLLFKENKLFSYLCDRVGIDEKKFREHLLQERVEREVQELSKWLQ